MNVIYFIPFMTVAYVVMEMLASKKYGINKLASSVIAALVSAMIVPLFMMVGVKVYTPSGVEMTLYKTIKVYLLGSAIYFIFFMLPLWIASRKP